MAPVPPGDTTDLLQLSTIAAFSGTHWCIVERTYVWCDGIMLRISWTSPPQIVYTKSG